MSNRFHSKYHRQNHHTYTNAFNPDAGHDPIASRDQPFYGDFCLYGALSCFAPLSATAGYFYSNNTALCALSRNKGLHIFSSNNINNVGAYIYSTGIALSAFAKDVGMNVYSERNGIQLYGLSNALISYSPLFGITSFGGTYAGSFLSNNKALSAYGGVYGLHVYAGLYGVDSSAGTIAGNFYSANRALSAYGRNIGLDLQSARTGLNVYALSAGAIIKSPTNALLLESPVVALSSGGGGSVVFQNRVGIFKTPQQYPYTKNIVLDVNGNSYFDGDLTVTGDLSAFGVFSYFDTKVSITSSLRVDNIGTDTALTVLQRGNQPIVAFYDSDNVTVPSLILDGNSARSGWLSLGSLIPESPFTLVKSKTQSNNQPQFRISDGQTVAKKIALGTESSNFAHPFFGTESNDHLLFNANNETKMFITKDGKVGIGLPSVNDIETQLHITGGIKLSANNVTLPFIEPENTSNAYIVFPAVGVAGFSDTAILRQIGTQEGTFGNYHLTLDLYDDDDPTFPQRNQQFSIRNVRSLDLAPDEIKNRITIDGRGYVGINTQTPDALTSFLTVNGQISSRGNIISSQTIQSRDIISTNNIQINNPTYGVNNAVTYGVGDSRYGVENVLYKNGDSEVTPAINNTNDWKVVDFSMALETGVWVFDMNLILSVNNILGVKYRIRFNTSEGSQTLLLTDIYGKTNDDTVNTKVLSFTSLPAVNDKITSSVNGALYSYRVSGTIQTVNAGNIYVEVANATANVDPQSITCKKFSFMRARKVA
jgi:hypothetical protein